MKEEIKLNCRFFKGDKPCKYNRLCKGCQHYSPMGKRMLIIKLASIGDVLRTTPILRALKRKYPKSYITWVTSLRSYEILKGNKFIDRILTYSLEVSLRMQIEEFDLVISLDKAREAAALATLIKAKKKKGYGLSKEGSLFPLNKEAEYEFSLGLSDELKFKKNKKTYQEMIFEIIGCEFKGEKYVLAFDNEQRNFSEGFFKKNNLTQEDFIIGLNIGCGDVFSQKKWTIDGFVNLTDRLYKKMNAKILILAGPEEEKRYKKILNKIKVPIIETNCHSTLKEFVALINCCNVVVSGDTLAMHIALALKKKVVVLFGPTCAQEVGLYDAGTKIVSSLDCSPCYRNSCDKEPNCMDNITVERVLNSIDKLRDKQ